MSKYAPPVVDWEDVFEALPAVPSPLVLRCAVYRPSMRKGRCHPCIEMVYVAGNGAEYVWRRWGAATAGHKPEQVSAALLRAAHEVWVFCEGKDPKELVKLVTWEVQMTR